MPNIINAELHNDASLAVQDVITRDFPDAVIRALHYKDEQSFIDDYLDGVLLHPTMWGVVICIGSKFRSPTMNRRMYDENLLSPYFSPEEIADSDSIESARKLISSYFKPVEVFGFAYDELMNFLKDLNNCLLDNNLPETVKHELICAMTQTQFFILLNNDETTSIVELFNIGKALISLESIVGSDIVGQMFICTVTSDEGTFERRLKGLDLH